MSDSSSSSEDANTERIKEAVWSSVQTRPGGQKNGVNSNRMTTSEHEHDGNELNTTPEFRSHVAKKLGAMLDSWISEVSYNPLSSSEQKQNHDDAFRLFSTSLPGNWQEEPKPPPAPKRRPVPSSSESDSELDERLREAAVSITDLLPHPSTEQQEDTERMKAAEEEEGTELKKKDKKKKKKKKKKHKVPVEREDEDEDEERTLERDRTVREGQRPEDRGIIKKKKKLRLEVH